jgi:hypothetical protein
MGNEDKPKQTIATPPQMVDVMIVPRAPVQRLTSATSLTVFQQNWVFAKQWRAASPSSRLVVEIPVDGTLADFEAAMTTAANKARGKEVTLAVGHGGAGSFRGLTQTVFDTIPETPHGMLHHRGAMTRAVLDLEKIAEKKGGKWVPREVVINGVKHVESQATVDDLSPRYDALTRVSEKLRVGGVSAFRILSCNIGKDAQFGSDLQKKLGIGLRLYGGLVAIAEASWTETGKPELVKEQVWIVDDEDAPSANRPPDDDPDHPSFHEIPTHRQRSFP